ncbi:surface adhesion protein Lsa26 [Leptospira sp. GIMC2001]|uniref:surface adhesion protein Lsa26 n=1 Tax=Leptospira sp. GIMC2001 TaxID=1513297 RepID=UPI002349F22C|nr:hypothetical protein [Leptospira sp. GIMC2001]WCL48512.1 hypothetical protein O4O04_14555 [Leptospira sp. GIMC2001]
MKKNNFLSKLFILAFVFAPTWLFAFGTYAEGFATAKIIQFESRGIIFNSYEGIIEVTSFEKTEVCDESKDEFFAPTIIRHEISVRPSNAELVNLLSKSVNDQLLIEYRIHRIEDFSLSSEMEIVSARPQERTKPAGLADKKVVKKTGSKRNFAVSGKILQLDYQGTFIGTYEGLYLDEDRGKVHPFSVTQAEMAKFAWETQKSSVSSSLGISVSFAKGFRKSDYDLFEINYREPAGGVHTAAKE